MIAKPPNGILVYQTYFKLSAYAHFEPILAAAAMAGEYPGALVILAGAVRNVVTKAVASSADKPAAVEYWPTSSGNFVFSLLAKML